MSSLERYGTIAFDPDMMRRTIGFGALETRRNESGGIYVTINPEVTPSVLQIGLWLAMVPEPYKAPWGLS